MISPNSPIAFYVGNFGVKYYSLFILLALVCGTFFSCFIAKKYYKNVSIDKILDILPVIILFSVFGARAYYVCLDWTYYSNHLNEIFMLWQGGLSIHGAVLFGFLGVVFCAKKYNLNLWQYCDVFSFGLLLGQIIGRLGNYFNIEAFGKPCKLLDWLCLYVPQIKRPIEFADISYFHPTFLYEMIWNVFVLAVLFVIIRKFVQNKDGVVFFVYLGLYSIGRFFIEGLRIDSVLSFGNIHFAQIACIFVFTISVCGIIQRLKSSNIKS